MANWIRELALLPVIVLLVIIGAFVNPAFLTADNFINVAQESAALGAVVVAEGLETQQQLKLVLAAGIDAGQGYLLGRPSEATGGEPIDMQALLGARMRFGAPFVEHIAS
jgi:simple sugar transport system permease protein